jgi:hypothetical protein
VSHLETGVPVWIGDGCDSTTLKSWLDTLTLEQKAAIKAFCRVDMHEPFKKAIREGEALAHVAIAHDPFHVIKRAGEAVTELRRSVFFRAGPELREAGKGALARAARLGEIERGAARPAPPLVAGSTGSSPAPISSRISCAPQTCRSSTTASGACCPARAPRQRAHAHAQAPRVVQEHLDEIAALGDYHRPTDRVGALTTTGRRWSGRGRGYGNHVYLLKKVRFPRHSTRAQRNDEQVDQMRFETRVPH